MRAEEAALGRTFLRISCPAPQLRLQTAQLKVARKQVFCKGNTAVLFRAAGRLG